MTPQTPKPAPSAITSTFKVSIAEPKNSMCVLTFCRVSRRYKICLWAAIYLKRRLKPKSQAAGLLGSDGISSSQTSNSSSGLTFRRCFKKRTMSKVFLGSASDRYLYCGCFVMSNLSLKNGLTPCTCKIHLPPSMTASSSGVISSLPHCQVNT